MDNITINITETPTEVTITSTGSRGPQGLPGTDGREVELQLGATYVQWRYAGESTWNDLIAVADLVGPQGPVGVSGLQGIQGIQGLPGDDGREIVLDANATHIVWQYSGDVSWTNLVALADLKGEQGDIGLTGPQGPIGPSGVAGTPGTNGVAGADGREVELQKSATHVQWKYDTDVVWTDLVALADLQGAQGLTGPEGPQGPAGPSGIGIQGPMGPEGPVGASGLQGLPGTNGADGREVELQNNGTVIQWKYDTDVSWTDLVAISGLKGDKGDTGSAGATGATGPQGPVGASGLQGVAGLDGSSVLNGTDVPHLADGDAGDFYINTTTHVIYGPKVTSSGSASVITIQPDEASGYDTYINSNGGNLNFGTNVALLVGGDATLANRPKRALIKVSLSGVPTNIDVLSAQLSVYCTAENDTSDQTLNINKALIEWFEGDQSQGLSLGGSSFYYRVYNTIGWTDGVDGGKPGTDYTAAATSSVVVSGINTWYTFDVTTDVQSILDGSSPNYGWFVIGENENTVGTVKTFASSNYATATYRPKLVITYNAAASWGDGVSLVGPTGATGPAGTNGLPGSGIATGGTAGQFLVKKSTTNYDTEWITTNEDGYGFVSRSETTIAFDGTNTFTLADAGSGWSYYRAGRKYSISGNKTAVLSATPPAAKGMYYIYIDSTDGTLSVGTSPWTLDLGDTKVPVATIAWDNALTPKYWLHDERHSSAYPRRVHWHEHILEGTQLKSGGVVAGYTVAGSTDAENTFGVTETKIVDEDIEITISGLSDPNGTDSVYNLMYRTATTTWVWETSPMPYRYTAAGYIQYDNNGTMTEGQTGRYYNSYLCYTNNAGGNGFTIIHGRGSFTSLALAQAETPTFSMVGVPLDEYIIAYQFTWFTNASYTTKGKCRLAATPVEVNTSRVSSTIATPLLSHNTLAGIQGGTANEYFHLTATQLSGIVPSGGYQGQRLAKLSDADYDFVWLPQDAFPIIYFRNLPDVDVAGRADGDTIIYSTADQRWHAQAPATTTTSSGTNAGTVYTYDISSQIATSVSGHYTTTSQIVADHNQVFWNGLLQEPTAITVDGNGYGFTCVGFVPASGDKLVVVTALSGTTHTHNYVANPMTVTGDMIIATTSGAATRLPVGVSGQVLKTIDGVPTWSNNYSQAIFTVVGTLVVASGAIRLYNATGSAKTISKVFLSVSTAPTGATIIADINKNGTTIFTSQANRPTIAVSGFTGSTTTINVPTWDADEYLTLDVDQIGSTIAGANLTAHVVYS
jgi:hypothetical protein